MSPELTTTNQLLAVIAAVSAIEGIALLALMAGAFFLYRRVMQTIAGIEERQIAPVTSRVNEILDDVKTVTTVARMLRRFGGRRAA